LSLLSDGDDEEGVFATIAAAVAAPPAPTVRRKLRLESRWVRVLMAASSIYLGVMRDRF
jgi:hypothetical protein